MDGGTGGMRLVDWDLAVRVGSAVAGAGPAISAAEAASVVAELREDARRSTPLVREFTGLEAQSDRAPVLVVDRGGWVKANTDMFEVVTAPLFAKVAQRKGPPSALAESIGSRVTATELGGMLGFLAGKVLGQFDPFHDTATEQGRLLLVAPNVVTVERELRVDRTDFRLWVCLHEETHRVQFTAVPWMREHLRDLLAKIVDEVPTEPGALIAEAAKRAGELVTGGSEGQRGSLLDLFASPQQRRLVDAATGVMSLLEGHADVVMDGVGPEVIGSVAEIRRKFDRRRQGAGGLDRAMRRLLGLDQKMAQYRDGAVFVRAVIDRVGMTGFNTVFAEPGNLPSLAEIHDPGAWVDRVAP